MTLNEMGARAKTAARALANAGALKESALLHAAGALWQRREELLAANALDVQAGREAGMSQALLDRLSLTEARIQDMAAAVEEVAKSADPVGKTLSGQRLPNGLQLEKVTVPTVMTAPPAIAREYNKSWDGARLEKTGVILSYICPLMYMNNPLSGKMPVITCSNKLRTYTTAKYYTEDEILGMITGGVR